MSKIVLNNGKSVEKPKSFIWVYIVVFILLVILAINITNFDIFLLIDNLEKGGSYIAKVFDFSNPEKVVNGLIKIQPEMLQTLSMAVVGTIFGMVFAFPVSLYCSINLFNNPFVWIVRNVLNVFRTIPIIVIAMVCKILLGATPFSATIAIFITTFLIAIKMVYEYVETLNLSSFESALALGCSKIQAIRYTIIPQIKLFYLSTSLYIFDMNVRTSSIIGLVGGAGIGMMLNDALYGVNTYLGGLILIELFIIIFVIDFVTKNIRKRLS